MTGDPMLLTLTMIVKDEAHTLGRTLASVRPFIDRWVILDTGSTDSTRDVIQGELAGVPGELHEVPFVDFETTRNEGLARCGLATDFILWLDADDELASGDAMREFLELHRNQGHDAFMMRVQTGILFSSLRIVRSGAGYRFEGAVHEVLWHPDRPRPSLTVPGAVIHHHPGPESVARSHARRERDIALLSAALERNPTHARSAFYLAMTYHWLGRHDEAVRALKRRIELGGWAEEVYQAKFALAEACERRGDSWNDVLALYLDAHAFAPHRAEPLYRIALHYNARAEHALALTFARRGADLPFPAQDVRPRIGSASSSLARSPHTKPSSPVPRTPACRRTCASISSASTRRAL